MLIAVIQVARVCFLRMHAGIGVWSPLREVVHHDSPFFFLLLFLCLCLFMCVFFPSGGSVDGERVREITVFFLLFINANG